VSKSRIDRLIQRLAAGDEFYLNDSPRISQAEIDEIECRIGPLQIESTAGADRRSPRAVYPLRIDAFRVAASEPPGEPSETGEGPTAPGA